MESKESEGRSAILDVVVYSPVRLFAEGVAACLDSQPESHAVACCQFDSVHEAVAKGRADIVLLDVTDRRVLAEGRRLMRDFPDLRVIALALPEAADEVIACADHGFVSYVPRNACVEDMREVLRRALREEVVCDPKVSGGLLRELRRRREMAAPADPCGDELTKREREVLRLLGRRLSNKEIARQLCLSTASVKNHVHSILTKLKVNGRQEVLARMEANGMIGEPAFLR
jgi:two-component system nitrate/nitrite response regulator NarL